MAQAMARVGAGVRAGVRARARVRARVQVRFEQRGGTGEPNDSVTYASPLASPLYVLWTPIRTMAAPESCTAPIIAAPHLSE